MHLQAASAGGAVLLRPEFNYCARGWLPDKRPPRSSDPYRAGRRHSRTSFSSSCRTSAPYVSDRNPFGKPSLRKYRCETDLTADVELPNLHRSCRTIRIQCQGVRHLRILKNAAISLARNIFEGRFGRAPEGCRISADNEGVGHLGLSHTVIDTSRARPPRQSPRRLYCLHWLRPADRP